MMYPENGQFSVKKTFDGVGVVTAVSVLAVLSFIALGLFKNYSFWTDELYSVVASSQSWQSLFKDWILPDVHPPLYQTLLKIWIGVFGNTETSARLMSAVLVVVALVAFIKHTLKEIGIEAGLWAILVFSSSYLPAYYGQEARPYALLLLLSVLLTFAFLKNIKENAGVKTKLLVLAVLLSLSHYFGLIYAVLSLLLLAWRYVRNLEAILKCSLGGLIMMAWPIIHLYFGGLTKKTGGNFWIENNGVATTVSHYTQALMPFLNAIFRRTAWDHEIISLLVVLLLLMIYVVHFIHRARKVRHWDGTGYMTVLTAIFLGAVAMIDRYTPISTNRNFIVLLPMFSILTGLYLHHLAMAMKPMVKTSMALMILAVNVVFSWTYTQQKSTPLENIRDAMTFAAKNCQYSVPLYMLHDRNDVFRPYNKMKFLEYYLGPSATERMHLVHIDELDAMKEPCALLMVHLPMRFNEKARSNRALHEYQPVQFSQDGAYVLFSEGACKVEKATE